MTVRAATEADLGTIRVLWEQLQREMGRPDHLRTTWEEERPAVEARLREGLVLLAEEEGEPVGFAEVNCEDARLAWLKSIYVQPAARRQGVAKRLLQEVSAIARARGRGYLGLEVPVANTGARGVYERLGFEELSRSMAVSLDELEARLGREPVGPSFGRVFVQTDDETAVERAVRSFLPRLGRSGRTVVSPPRNGWIEVEDELSSSEPKLLQRLAKELSYRTAAVVLALGIEEGAVVRYVLYDRGAVADEYASIPEYHGPLPPGDVVGLSANPRVAARLTGADPERVRAVARTAASPAELPPPEELYRQLAEVLGVGSGT